MVLVLKGVRYDYNLPITPASILRENCFDCFMISYICAKWPFAGFMDRLKRAYRMNEGREHVTASIERFYPAAST